MQATCTATQTFPTAGSQKLSIILPAGQSIGSMSFTKEQREAQGLNQQTRKHVIPPAVDDQPIRPIMTLMATASKNRLPQQIYGLRPDAASVETEVTTGKSKRGDSLTDLVQDKAWQDSQIPLELEQVAAEIPEEIRNIVQESMDEQRALQASRISTTQAIIVRTTIVQSRTDDEQASRRFGSQSSIASSLRRTISSTSDNRSSGESLDVGSTTSLGSEEGHPQSPTSYDEGAGIHPLKSHIGASGLRATLRKTLQEGGVLKHFAIRKGKEKASANLHQSSTSECTSCFDEVPDKHAVALSCQHDYCIECFSQLVSTAIRTESTFPPKCCLQEIPRKTLLTHLHPEDMIRYKEKALEYAVAAGDRYYCASPECAKWIDVRLAHSCDGCLQCPHCAFSMCMMCRGAAHGKNQDCPNDFGLDATLQQAERAGWQRCYNCRAVVELNTGCRHITCKCRAEFCYTCGARWKTCRCTEDDQRRREEEIRQRLDRLQAESQAEEVEVRAAIEAAERQMAEEREAEEERLAEEARQLTAREYARLEEITEFFEYLLDNMERVRTHQKQAIQRRQDEESLNIEARERSLTSDQSAGDQEQGLVSERKRLLMQSQELIKAARKKHANQLVETVGRHRRDQDLFLVRSNEAAEFGTDQTAVLDELMQAQDLERSTVRSQQTQEIQKLQRRAEWALQDFDRKAETARAEIVRRQVEAAKEVAQLVKATQQQHYADWKWYGAIFQGRAAMLAEDEDRMILSGADAPKWPYISIFE